MKSLHTNREQTAHFRIVTLMLAIAPLWLMMAAANTSAQTSNDVSTLTTTTSPAPSNWSQLLEDNMQRWNPNETILGVNNVGSLALAWDSSLSSCCLTSMISSPAVVNGVVYFVENGGTIYALDASTSAIRWSAPGGDPTSSPAVANGVVYIGSNGVLALNASTGAKLWSFAAGSTGFFSSPAVANGAVYIGSFDHNVYALNASTGAKLWSYNTGNQVDTSPAVANGVVYIYSVDTLYALNASTGTKLWSYFPEGSGGGLPSSPAVANGVVYLNDGPIYALDASTGAKLWSSTNNPNGYAGLSSPTIANGMLYVRSASGSDLPPTFDSLEAFSLGAELFLRIQPTPATVHQGDLITYAFPVWNLGPVAASHEVLITQVPAGTTFDYIRIFAHRVWAPARLRHSREQDRSSATKTAPWLPTPRGQGG